MITKRYACIGSRETPQHILKLTFRFTNILAELGYSMYSGGCPKGMDYAGLRGAYSHKNSDKSKNRIYISWEGMSGLRHDPENGFYCPQDHFENYKEAAALGEKARGGWHNAGRGSVAHHSRNPYQVLGDDLNSPVDFVLTWAPYKSNGPQVTGGTATAVKIALERDIPVFNLIEPDLEARLEFFCNVVHAQHREKCLRDGKLIAENLQPTC
jgi:hypothetical protein